MPRVRLAGPETVDDGGFMIAGGVGRDGAPAQFAGGLAGWVDAEGWGIILFFGRTKGSATFGRRILKGAPFGPVGVRPGGGFGGVALMIAIAE